LSSALLKTILFDVSDVVEGEGVDDDLRSDTTILRVAFLAGGRPSLRV